MDPKEQLNLQNLNTRSEVGSDGGQHATGQTEESKAILSSNNHRSQEAIKVDSGGADDSVPDKEPPALEKVIESGREQDKDTARAPEPVKAPVGQESPP
jgi:hypothetical protein